MKTLTGIFVALGLSGAVASEADAARKPVTPPAKTAKAIPTGYQCTPEQKNERVRVDAAFDLKTGALIYGEADTRFNQASMTKRLVELMTYEALRSGKLHREDRVMLPASFLVEDDGEIQYTDAVPYRDGKGKNAQRIASVSVSDALIALKRGSSNRAVQGLMIKLFGTESAGVKEMNAWTAREGLSGMASYATVTGFPTIAMKYTPHYTTPFAHAFVVWKLHTEFASEVKEFSVPRPTVTGYTDENRPVKINVKLTSRFLPGNMVGDFMVEDLKTGTSCLGTGIDIVARDRATDRDIVFITAGHDPNGGTKSGTVARFFGNMPAEAREKLQSLALSDGFTALASAGASLFSKHETFLEHAERTQAMFLARRSGILAANMIVSDPNTKSCPASNYNALVLSSMSSILPREDFRFAAYAEGGFEPLRFAKDYVPAFSRSPAAGLLNQSGIAARRLIL